MKTNITKQEWKTTSVDKEGNVIHTVTTISVLTAIYAMKELSSVGSDA